MTLAGNPLPAAKTRYLPSGAAWTRPSDWLSLGTLGSHEFRGLFGITNDDANYVALFASIPVAITQKSSGGAANTTSGTPNFNLAANRLCLIAVENSHATSPATPSIPAAAGRPTFTLRATTTFNGGLSRVSLFSAATSATWSGSVSIEFGSSQAEVAYSVQEIAGVDTSVNDGVVQTVAATGNGTTPSATLAAFGNSYRSTYGAIANASSALTVGSGFTSINNTFAGTPTRYLGVEWRQDAVTTVNGTITSGEWGMIAAEIATSNSYQVDWGDGTVETWATNTKAQHKYAWDDADLVGTECWTRAIAASITFTDSGDIVTLARHGLAADDPVQFSTITSTTGVSTGTTYHVVNPTADTFQLSTTSGGSAISLTTNGSGTILLPYRQAVVKVTLAGDNVGFGVVSLQQYHGTLGSAARAVSWLDVELNSSTVTTFRVTNNSSTGNQNAAYLYMLEKATLSSHGLTDFGYLFAGGRSLQSVSLSDSPTVTNVQHMFDACFNLVSAPLFNTSSVTNFTYMFSQCFNLQSVPLFQIKTSGSVDMSYMFSNCYSLRTVPLFNTGSVTNMVAMFQACYSLESVPLFNTASVTNMGYMFYQCYSLQTVPLFNTASVTNMDNTFSYCYSLMSVPLFNTAAVLSFNQTFLECRWLTEVPFFSFKTTGGVLMTGMFSSCYKLQFVPLFNTTAVTDMANTFSSCVSLKTVPLFRTSAVTTMAGMFNGAGSLQTLPPFDCSAVNSSTNIISLSGAISSLVLRGLKYSLSVTSHKLSLSALHELMDGLGIGSSATLTVTGNYGHSITGIAGGATSVSSTVDTTAGSATVACTNTANLALGMEMTGTGISTALSVTSDVTADTLTYVGHGIANGTEVSFSGLGTTTGVSTYTRYFVVNAAADTFQVALTFGGAAINLTGSNATMTLLRPMTIVSIVANTSVTLSAVCSANGTAIAATSTTLQRWRATLKNWAVTL